MIVKKFKASKVFDYIDFDIDFNDELNFLIGGNGSGKTTVLRLIDAILSFRLKELLQIKYKYIEIIIYHQNQEINLTVRRENNEVAFLFQNKNELKVPIPKETDSRRFQFSSDRDIYEELKFKYQDSAYVKDLESLPKIHFLSLDRNVYSFSRRDEEMYARRKFHSPFETESPKEESYLLTGFSQAKDLILDEVKRIKDAEKKLENNLRTKFLTTSLNYIKNDDVAINFIENLNNNNRTLTTHIESFLKRKDDFTSVISNLFKFEIEDHSENEKMGAVEKKLQDFFSSLESALKELNSSHENKGVSLNILVNYGQILRLEELNRIVTDFNSKKQTINKQLNKFVEVINYFYKGSSKRIEISNMGKVKISSSLSEEITVMGLSSGEMHLFVIFTFLAFSKNAKKGGVIFIDEPELSLHLNWQENLIDKLRELNTTPQLILATHSPEIVSSYNEYCLLMNQSGGKQEEIRKKEKTTKKIKK